MNRTEAVKLKYETVHTENCDGHCDFEHIRKARFTEIMLGENALPVVRYEQKPDGTFELAKSTIKLGKDRDYVAIAHVWAEGLGKTRDNAMPSCQLHRIQNLVAACSQGHSKYFWIDTLCVPQDNFRPHLQPLRISAIQAMGKIYRSSAAVLVLDSELLSTSSLASVEERLVRFACCSWIRRLWTLQEAVKGPRVLLQFSDTAENMMSDIILRLQNFAGFFTLTQTVLTEVTDFLWRIKLVKEPDRYPRITALWNACQFRSTSERQDEALCLAIMMGLDPGPILAVPQEEKWRKFQLLQKTFPKDLLFSKRAEGTSRGFPLGASTLHPPGRQQQQPLSYFPWASEKPVTEVFM